jgi:hypothetical protein
MGRTAFAAIRSIVTPMNKDQGAVIEATLINGSLLKRAGQPIEIAYAAFF